MCTSVPYCNCRLYTKAIFLGFRRGLRTQDTNTSLLKIDGVGKKEDTAFYLGKRVAYIYRVQKKERQRGRKPSKYRVIWGRVTRSHGNSGVVKAKFRNNLPPKAMGASLKVVSGSWSERFVCGIKHLLVLSRCCTHQECEQLYSCDGLWFTLRFFFFLKWSLS